MLARFDYDLDANGRRTGVTETDEPGKHHTRRPGSMTRPRRLTGEAYDAPGTGPDYLTAYDMDLAGNRLEKATDTSPTPQAVDAFFADGTLTPDEKITYAYDAGDRLLVEKLDSTATARSTGRRPTPTERTPT